MHKSILFIFIIFFLSGCKKELQVQNVKMVEAQKNDLYEAKFYDVAIPIGISPNPKYITDNSYSYLTISTLKELVLFYDTEMERYGWRKIGEFKSFEVLLIYIKPNNRSVSISIRPDISNKINVYIFYNNCND